MKKVTVISLFLLVAGMCISCGQKEQKFHIGVSQCSDDEWRNQMNKEILREANFYEELSVEILTSKDDSKQQCKDIRYFIDQEVDLLIVAPNEASPITPVVEEAFNKGIPVIIVDRKILSDRYTAFIGADNLEIGKAVGTYIANLLQGKGKVIEITGLKGSTPAIERHRGFTQVLKEENNIELLAVTEGDWLQASARHKMDSLLQCYPEVNLVFAQNDRMANGAYDAARKYNREKDMKFIGIDALSGEGYGLENVLEGKLDATFIYPTGGDKVIQLAMEILLGHNYPRETVLSTSIVDATNAPIMKMQTSHITALDKKIEMMGGKINEYLTRYATQQVVLYGSLLVLLLVAGLLVAVYLSLRTKNKLNRMLFKQKEKLEVQKDKLEKQKNQLENQKNQLEEQKDQLERLSQEVKAATHAKLVFFTNVSHDFRTPLTLIADPIEVLLKDESISDSSRKLLELIKKNVHILLRLINQILDFRKVENGRMKMHMSSINLLDNLRNWNDAFRMALLKKHIKFSLEAEPGTDFQLIADEEKMECIYFNLLSNAIKYTPENGEIAINLTADNNQYTLKVFNSGSRIPETDTEAIFERFYQINGHQAGTGIGLALVRAFVEMHGGNINAHSDNKGTYFVVNLPQNTLPNMNATPIELPLEEENEEVSTELIDAELDNLPEEPMDADAATVLIIDDNADIRTYIKSFLSKDYRVLQADNGVNGLKMAMKYVPDVIISDIMMPEMDGTECCRRLKSEMQTSHIPIILLTACALDEQRIEGYDGGADSYISKPFNSQLLAARVRNLITNRKLLRKFFSEEQPLEKVAANALDKDFLTRFKMLVEEQMKDSELNVEDLGRDMGMSRVQLYRKLKSLTNYSPNELLRQMRLKKAASLLASSDLSIAEIAYEVGFSSPSYFTKCYKEQFGESPTDFLKRTHKQK